MTAKPVQLINNPGICFLSASGPNSGLLRKLLQNVAVVFKVPRLWELGPDGDISSLSELPLPQGEYNMLVSVCSNGERKLTDFYHPRQAIYVFGNDEGQQPDFDGLPHVTVRPPVSVINQMAAIVFYDRMLKETKLLDEWHSQTFGRGK